jgi:hypothetical protein
VRTSNRFQTLFEQFPTFGLKKERPAGKPARHLKASGEHNLAAEAQRPINELDRAHYLLASSIDALHPENDSQSLTEDQRFNVQKVVDEDAEDLASQVLPPDVVDLLELTPKSPEHTGASYVSDEPIELRTLYLLVHAYDTTGNAHIKHASEYILDRMAPQAVELLQEAYQRGNKTGGSIIAEFKRLSAGIDSALEDTPLDNPEDNLDAKLRLLEVEPGAPDTTRAVGIAAMKAADGKNIDPFVKSYLKNMAFKQKAARTKPADRSSK